MTPFVGHLAAGAPPPPPPSGVEFEATVKTNTGLVSSAEIGLPSGLSGKLAVVLIRCGRAPVHYSTPTGWVKLIESSSTGRMALYYRVCDGTEGASITIALTDDLDASQTGRVSALAWRVDGVATTEAAFIEAEQDTLTADPPALTPSWGSAENAWLAVYSSRRSDWSVSNYPSNYGALDTVFNGSENDLAYVGVAVGERTLTASSENPGAFNINAPNGVNAERTFTVALRAA